jgi:hypothetical protein
MQTAEEHIKNSEDAMIEARNFPLDTDLRNFFIDVAQVEATLAVATAQLEANEIADAQ